MIQAHPEFIFISTTLIFFFLLPSCYGGYTNSNTCNDLFKHSCLNGTKLKELLDKAETACKCKPNLIKETDSQRLEERLEEKNPDIKCTINNGVPCQFPFEYRGKKYNKCINKDLGGVYWCKTGDNEWDFGACNTSIPLCIDSYDGGCPSNNPTRPCVFPFMYLGKKYNGCTVVDFGRRWCGTAPEVNIVNWAECEPSCPQDDTQSEYCVLKELGWVENDEINEVRIKEIIETLLEDNVVIQQKMLSAHKACFAGDEYLKHNLEGYLKNVKHSSKLACLKLSLNSICDE